ncbi:MAG: hypothetical protein RL069_1992, partial [Planctomycetota bacterium]
YKVAVGHDAVTRSVNEAATAHAPSLIRTATSRVKYLRFFAQFFMATGYGFCDIVWMKSLCSPWRNGTSYATNRMERWFHSVA